jgi:hypothetical protein
MQHDAPLNLFLLFRLEAERLAAIVQHEATLNLFLLFRLEAERLAAECNMRPTEPFFDCSGWRLKGWQLSAICGCTAPPLKRTSTWAASSNT